MSYQYDVKRMEEEEEIFVICEIPIFVICEILKFVYSNLKLKCLTLKRNCMYIYRHCPPCVYNYLLGSR